MTFPMFVPLLAMEEYNISGSMVGLILCTPALTSIAAVPILDRYIIGLGVELVIFCAGICFGLAFIIFGLSTLATTTT